VTPAAGRCLAAARQSLADAEAILALPIPRVAAREAYMAAYHAAEALVIERTGRTVKTHASLRTEFARLGQGSDRIGRWMTTFLANGFRFKSLSDYDVTQETPITGANAEALIAEARTFVARIEELLQATDRTR
jgi:uncharacterized protein (UPF0332 family)